MAEFKQMSCREGGAFDHKNGLKHQLTGWGKICKERQTAGISRRARIRARKSGNNERNYNG